MASSAESQRALVGSHKRAPDFFIVGSPKTGTTSLYETLRRHPQIYMPDFKEPRFLASDMRARFAPKAEARLHAHPDTLDDYLALFEQAAPEQRVGEASTSYLRSRTAADAIAELQPDARIIAILREPASLLRSLHIMFLRVRIEAETDLEKAISLEDARRAGKHIPRSCHMPQALQYSDHVRYTEQLRRYHERFPPEHVLVLIYDDFLRDNEGTVRRVLQFLEVDDRRPVDVVNLNVTKRTVRSWRAKQLVTSLALGQGPISRSAKSTVKALTTRRLRRGALGTIQRHVVQPDPPPPDARFMTELRRRFKGEVLALSEYLDRDLVSLWGYNDVD